MAFPFWDPSFWPITPASPGIEALKAKDRDVRNFIALKMENIMSTTEESSNKS